MFGHADEAAAAGLPSVTIRDTMWVREDMKAECITGVGTTYHYRHLLAGLELFTALSPSLIAQKQLACRRPEDFSAETQVPLWVVDMYQLTECTAMLEQR